VAIAISLVPPLAVAGLTLRSGSLSQCLGALLLQAVAEHWANDAGWSVVGVVATGDRVLVNVTGPRPSPDLAVLRRDLDDAGLAGLDVRVSLVTVSYKPLPG